MKTTLLTLASLVLSLASATAHSVWIEPLPTGELVLRFAEWGEDFEKAPGPLAALSPAQVLAPAAITATLKTDHILLEKTQASQVAVITTGFTVMKRRLPLFHARWWPAASGKSTPLTKLDLVPGDKPNEVTAYFDGKPMAAGIELKLRSPTGPTLTLTTNDQGTVTLPTATEKGLHQLSLAKHSEQKPGELNGTPYDITSHNASLTWIVTQ